MTGDYWLLEVEAPEIAGALAPGQFVNIRVSGELVPFLRRPFSVYRVSPDRKRLQVAYKVLGDGTRLMTENLIEGGRCDLLGPLGRGFSLPEAASGLPPSAGASASPRCRRWSSRRPHWALRLMGFSAPAPGQTL